MPATLLDTQFAALEPPSHEEDAITVSIDAPVDAIVAQLAAALTGTGHDPQQCALNR
jgi:gluconokinase